MQVTFYGHSTFLVKLPTGVRILFDPFISPNEKTKGIVDISTIEADYILVTHGHSDHVADVETIARQSGATIVAAYEIAAYYGGKGLNYHPMNIGGQWDFGRFKVRAVNAVHSSVLPDGTYAGNPMGFIVTDEGGRSFYYSGDTALTMDMQLIGKYYRVDNAFLCLGDNFTMGIDDAIIAAEFIKCNNIIGMHFDTFPYINVNHDMALEKFKAAGVSLRLPEIGESFEVE